MLLLRIKNSVWFNKLTRWEFWPFWTIYWITIPYWVWLIIKNRSFFFFTASNPGIDFGGMLGESKIDILNKIPGQWIPATISVDPKLDFIDVIKSMEKNGLKYPVIAKPDVGERGWRVRKVQNESSLREYHQSSPIQYLIQEYIDLPVELGVFYFRYPNQKHGIISSIVEKLMLSVKGDGIKCVRELIESNPRAKMQVGSLSSEILNRIPSQGQTLELVAIGNHCKGTTFLNGSHLITAELCTIIDQLSIQIDGFYFGRYDIRAASYKDLQSGNFMVMELNGAGSEPGHIYHPGRSIWKGYRDIFYHLKVLGDICILNHRRGIPYWSFQRGLERLRLINRYKKIQEAYA